MRYSGTRARRRPRAARADAPRARRVRGRLGRRAVDRARGVCARVPPGRGRALATAARAGLAEQARLADARAPRRPDAGAAKRGRRRARRRARAPLRLGAPQRRRPRRREHGALARRASTRAIEATNAPSWTRRATPARRPRRREDGARRASRALWWYCRRGAGRSSSTCGGLRVLAVAPPRSCRTERCAGAHTFRSAHRPRRYGHRGRARGAPRLCSG